MRAALIALALIALPAFGQAPPVTFHRWQDMGAYIGQQTEKINDARTRIDALESKLADTEASLESTRSDLSLMIGRYDIAVRYFVVNACATNRAIADGGWAATLVGIKPFQLGNLECPPVEGLRYYIPTYLSPAGPLIPPAP